MSVDGGHAPIVVDNALPCAVRSQNAARAFSRRRSRIIAQRAVESGPNSRVKSELRHLDSCREERVMLQGGSRVIDEVGPTWGATRKFEAERRRPMKH